MKQKIIDCVLVVPEKKGFHLVISADACERAFGYVAYDPERGPIAYGGKLFNAQTANCNSSFELELKALSIALSELYIYLSIAEKKLGSL